MLVRSPAIPPLGIALKARQFLEDVVRALLYFFVNAADVFTNDSRRNQLHSAEKKHRSQSERPIEESAMENVAVVETKGANADGCDADDHAHEKHGLQRRR